MLVNMTNQLLNMLESSAKKKENNKNRQKTLKASKLKNKKRLKLSHNRSMLNAS